MFTIGIPELIVILCAAVVFVRPRDIPRLFRRLGRMYGRMKKAYEELMATKDRLVSDIETEAEAATDGEKAAGRPPDGGGTPDARGAEGGDAEHRS